MATARPRILFNAVQSVAGGGRIYLEEVAPRLSVAGAPLDWLVLVRPAQAEGLRERGCRVLEVDPPAGGGAFLWNQQALPRVLHREGAALAYTSANVGSLTLGTRSVSLLQNSFDAARAWTGWRSRANWLAQRVLTSLSLRRSRFGIVVSASFRDELVRRFGVPPSWLEVVHHGVSESMTPHGEAARVGDGPYLLAVGDVYPHKNLERVVEAFARLVPRRPGLSLALAGREVDAPCARGVRARAGELGISHRVVWLGWRDRASLAALYRGASAALCLSTAEAFGIAQIEAMASGIPLVASDLPFAREVCEEAALYVRPEDPSAIAAAVERALDDAPLRARLIRDGLRRASTFTWDACASRTAAAIERRVTTLELRRAGA